MTEGIVDTAANSKRPQEKKFYGVAIAIVIDNCDTTKLGRVQVRFPWLPEHEPWARIASPMAGPNRGMYFIPQVDDEVLVAFNQGDINEPYVVGSLWNGLDEAPMDNPLSDPENIRRIRTPAGHELEFDDSQQTLRIINSEEHEVSMESEKIVIKTAGNESKITLNKDGTIDIEARDKLKLKSRDIVIEGENVEIKSSANMKINGGSDCEIQASIVRIN